MRERDIKAEERKARQQYPGAAIDAADDNKVKPKEVKERTDVLDFNPHTDGI